MKDIAVTIWGNNRGFTPLTPKGFEWLSFHDVRNLTNRVWGATLIVGPGKADMVLKALESQTEITILLEVEESVEVVPASVSEVVSEPMLIVAGRPVALEPHTGFEEPPVKIELDAPAESVKLNLDADE